HTHPQYPAPLLSSPIPRPPRPTLFPYTTLFRSQGTRLGAALPKAYVRLQGHSLVERSVCAMLDSGVVDDVAVIVAASMEYHAREDRKSTRLNSSHVSISYAVFCLKKKTHISIEM